MILYAGDPHGVFDPLRRAVHEHRPEAVVVLGDFGLERPLDVELGETAGLTDWWWIHGNHDCDREDLYDNLFGSALAERNLHGQVQTIDGLRIAGLGGVFRTKIWDPRQESGPKFSTRKAFLGAIRQRDRWRGGLPLKQRGTIWYEDYQRLVRQRADVLVCHEAPSGHRHGWAVIDDLARKMGVRLVVHGHHHTDYMATLENGISVVGVGLASVADESGRLK